MTAWKPISGAVFAEGDMADLWLVNVTGMFEPHRVINCHFGQFFNDEWGWMDEDGDGIEHSGWTVTRWMPVPDAPGGKP